MYRGGVRLALGPGAARWSVHVGTANQIPQVQAILIQPREFSSEFSSSSDTSSTPVIQVRVGVRNQIPQVLA